MKHDKFLIGILVFIGVLLIAALALFFAHANSQTYLPEETPQNVIHNYLLAVQLGDFERAYSYLKEDENMPTLDEFRQSIQYWPGSSNADVEIGDAKTTGDQAMVEVLFTYGSADPFESPTRGWNNSGLASLSLQNGEWKIAAMPSPYWNPAWYLPPSKQ